MVMGGAAIGATIRWGASSWLDSAEVSWGVLAVNTVGSFILGAAVAMVGPGVGPARVWRFFVGLGACGGLTTFSTLAVKEVDDADSRSLGVGLAYLGATLALGLLGAAGGTVGVERMVAS